MLWGNLQRRRLFRRLVRGEGRIGRVDSVNVGWRMRRDGTAFFSFCFFGGSFVRAA